MGTAKATYPMRSAQAGIAHATPWSGKIAVLVSSMDAWAFPAVVMPKHYRDRADADTENCFDELKNQWGWGGYTSRRLASSHLMANLVALVYNWWSLYLRFYDEGHQRWTLLLTRVLRRWLGGKWLPGLPEDAELLLSG